MQIQLIAHTLFTRFFMKFVVSRKSLDNVFCKKDVLKNFAKFTGKHLYQCLFLNKVAEDLAQVFSCEFCEIFKNTFSSEHLQWGCFWISISY